MNQGPSRSTEQVEILARPVLRLAAAVAAAVALSVFAVGRAQAPQAPQAAGITVNGSGTAYGSPDTAILDLGVSIFDADVSAAMAQADERMVAIREALISAGVEESDIRTAGLSLWREQQYDQSGNPTNDRYQVWHNYNVTVRDVDSVGAVISAAVAAGANNIGGVQFTIADPSGLEREARETAMADAQARAEHLAQITGVTLGAPTSITEGYGGYMPQVRQATMYDGMGSGIATGELAVTVNVTVTYGVE